MAKFIEVKVVDAEAEKREAANAAASPTAYPDVNDPLLDTVRKSLGRAADERRLPPAPPIIEEPLVRLVYSDLGLAELFAKRAEANHMHVHLLYVDELAAKLTELLKSLNVKSVGYAKSDLLEKIGVPETLRSGGFESHGSGRRHRLSKHMPWIAG